MQEQITSNRCLPELEARIVFVSAGNGKGHAVPDMAIGRELTKLAPNLAIQFVSYATGAEAYRGCGYPVIDMHAPDSPPYLDMVVAFTRLLRHMAPAPLLIVSHEEYSAVTAANALEIPCVFITDFFMDPNSMWMYALKAASEIIFIGEQGLYTEPPLLRNKIHYVGRGVRAFEYSLADRERARTELAIPRDAIVALLQPGAYVESRVPMAELLLAAWRLLPDSPKRLIWLAGRDLPALQSRYGKEADLILLQEDWKIDRLMAASNVLITKANRVTVYEAAAMGLPSISVSMMANWPDDVAVANVASNTPLSTDGLTPQRLADAIQDAIASTPTPATSVSQGVFGAAERIAHLVERTVTDSRSNAGETSAHEGQRPYPRGEQHRTEPRAGFLRSRLGSAGDEQHRF
jgi:UDP-N-acetylglucosamine:LPS N-acetylglucosamine transferase